MGLIPRTSALPSRSQLFLQEAFPPALSANCPPASLVKIGEKSGYVDKTGKQAIRLQFDGDFIAGGNFIYSSEREPGSFSEGLTAVAIKDNDATIGLGYINKRGQLVIKTEFHEIDNFSEGLAAVETSNGICGVRFNYCAYGYIDKTGKMVIEPKFFSSK